MIWQKIKRIRKVRMRFALYPPTLFFGGQPSGQRLNLLIR